MGRLRDWIGKQIPPRTVYVEKAYSVSDFQRDIESQFQGGTADILNDYASVGDPFQTNAVVYAAVKKKATNISGVEWQILNGSDDPVANPKLDRLFDHPYPNTSWPQFVEGAVSNLELTGKAYVHLGAESGGVPTSMRVLNSNFMKLERDKAGVPTGYSYGNGAKRKPLTLDEVMLIPYWHPTDPWDGLAPITAARLDVLQQFHANQYNANFFKQGGLLKGFFKNTSPRALTPEQEKELERSLGQRGGGGNRTAHKIPVFSNVEYVPVGISQKDMEFLLLQGYSRDQILMVLGVPKAILGFSDGFNYANMNAIMKDFWNKSLFPIMGLLEFAFRIQFFDRFAPTLHGAFNRKAIPELQADLSLQATTAKTFYDMGVPFAVLNERLDLGFPEFELEDRTPPQLRLPEMPQDAPEKPLPAPPPSAKDIAKQIRADMRHEALQRRVAREKALPFDRELRRAEWLQSEKRMQSREDKLLPKVRGFFSTARDQVFAYLTSNPAKAVSKDTVSTEWIQRFREYLKSLGWGRGLLDATEPELSDTYTSGARRTYWGLGLRFDLPPERAQAFVRVRGIKLAGATDEVVNAILSGLEQGMPTAKLSQHIQSVFDGVSKARATLIARTETTVAYNGGRVGGMKELGITKKQWINSEDNTVRDSHRIESVVEVDEPFTLANGERVMYPGDGPASEACNCRCTVTSVFIDTPTKGLALDDEVASLEADRPRKRVVTISRDARGTMTGVVVEEVVHGE